MNQQQQPQIIHKTNSIEPRSSPYLLEPEVEAVRTHDSQFGTEQGQRTNSSKRGTPSDPVPRERRWVAGNYSREEESETRKGNTYNGSAGPDRHPLWTTAPSFLIRLASCPPAGSILLAHSWAPGSLVSWPKSQFHSRDFLSRSPESLCGQPPLPPLFHIRFPLSLVQTPVSLMCLSHNTFHNSQVGVERGRELGREIFWFRTQSALNYNVLCILVSDKLKIMSVCPSRECRV